MWARKLSYYHTSNRLLSWVFQQRPTNAPRRHSTCSLRNSVQQRKPCDVIFVGILVATCHCFSFLQFSNFFTWILFPQNKSVLRRNSPRPFLWWCIPAGFRRTWATLRNGDALSKPVLCCAGLWIRIRSDLEFVEIERFRDTFIPDPTLTYIIDGDNDTHSWGNFIYLYLLLQKKNILKWLHCFCIVHTYLFAVALCCYLLHF